MIKIQIEVLGLIHIKKYKSNDIIELSDNATINTLMSKLGIIPEHQKFISVFVDKVEKKGQALLADGNIVTLFLPTGGG